MKKLLNLGLIVLVIGLSVSGYYLYKTLPLEYKEFSISSKNDLPIVTNVSSSLVQFSQNMRFAKENLSYSIDPSCSEKKTRNIEGAFQIIHDETKIIDFYRVFNIEPDIIVMCSKESKYVNETQENAVRFIAGEGGPRKYLELNPYPLIIQGEIQLYSSPYSGKRERECERPLVELHELLHVFGFNHIDNKSSVLYPYLSCDQEFSNEIISNLQALYKEPARAELSIRNITASKAGQYMDYEIEISNTGLINATEIVIEISSEGKKLDNLEMEEISPGMSRTITTKNFKLSSLKTNTVSFRVVSSTEEYSLENNFVELIL